MILRPLEIILHDFLPWHIFHGFRTNVDCTITMTFFQYFFGYAYKTMHTVNVGQRAARNCPSGETWDDHTCSQGKKYTINAFTFFRLCLNYQFSGLSESTMHVKLS